MPDRDQRAKDPTLTQDNLVESAERVILGDLPPEKYFQAVERHAENMADLEAKRPRLEGLLARWQLRRVSRVSHG
ncbi:hypothetical protein [Nonomuraea zeae]|uniref:Uncharacterized protein n=1 Tax=Nonomuraea zeae TaxID=1642303 RepID=A0A5S4GRW1_9ACTN|nr:hypothetical protein [Nonomuraea zeae]TMR35224.1 hypothetical protein ETD85_14620 [Nonomuraea zeae]